MASDTDRPKLPHEHIKDMMDSMTGSDSGNSQTTTRQQVDESLEENVCGKLYDDFGHHMHVDKQQFIEHCKNAQWATNWAQAMTGY